MDRTSLVYKGFPPNHCCCDTALRILPNGEWICIFMTGGNREPEPENHIELCRSTDEGYVWSNPEIVKRFDDKACLLSEVYLHQGTLTIMMQTHAGDFSDWQNWTIQSTDFGHTWSRPERFALMPRRTFLRNLFISTWGEWFLPYQTYDTVDDPIPAPHKDGSFKNPENGVLISGDEGATWERSTPAKPSHAWAENNVIELSDGTLAMLIRNDGTGTLYRSDSTDRGRTWSETRSVNIPNPGTKFRLYRLSDRRIILIHNPNNKTSHPNSKSAAQCNRNPLAMWISDDDMKSWKYQRELCSFPGMLAYPDGVVDKDEKWVHFTFDYNRHDVIYYGAELP